MIEYLLINFLLQEGGDGGEDSQEEQRPPDITPIGGVPNLKVIMTKINVRFS